MTQTGGLMQRIKRRLYWHVLRPCPACDGEMHGLRVRLMPGAKWQGPYWRCTNCNRFFHTERMLVDHDGVVWPQRPT
jgi:hypothetical protein